MTRSACAVLVLGLLAGCGGSGDDRCAQAARGATAAFLRQAGQPGVVSITDQIAARFEVVMRTRCRDDGWAAEATTCLGRGDIGCWHRALTDAQRTRVDAAMQATIAAAKPAPPAAP